MKERGGHFMQGVFNEGDLGGHLMQGVFNEGDLLYGGCI